MAKALPLPDGTTVAIREGETPAQTWERAQRMYPEAFGASEETKPKQDTSGLKAAFSASATRLGGQSELLKGKLGIQSEAEAQQKFEAAEKKASERFTPTEKGFTEAPFLKVRELLGGSLPYAVAPAAAGIAALALPVSAPVAIGAGLLGAGAVSTGQFTGSNLAAQVDTGKSLEEASLGKAFAAAVPQALIDTAAMALLPGVGKLFSSVGSKLTTEQAKAIANQTLSKAAMDYTAKTGMAMGREGLTEVAQQSLERLQAGLSITDPEARKEYIDSFIGGAVLGGTLAPVGRAFERSGAKSQAARAERDERNVAAKEAAEQAHIAAEQEEAKRQTPEYALEVAKNLQTLEQEKIALQQQVRKITKNSPTEAEDKAFNKDIQAQLKANSSARNELAPEVNRLKQSGVYQQALEQERVAGMSPMDYMLERTGEVRDRKTTTPAADTAYEESGLAFQEPVVPAKPLSPEQAAQQYVAQRIALAQDQLPEVAPADYVDYLMQDPLMVDQVLETRTKMPGLNRQENEVVLGALKLQRKEQEKARQAQGVQGTAAGQQRIAGVEAEEQAALEEQRAQAERDAKEAQLAPGVGTEIMALRKIAANPTISVKDEGVLSTKVTVLWTCF